LDKAARPDAQDEANLLARYQRVLRRLRLRHLLPWAQFQFGARWHRFSAEPRASACSLSEFEDRWGISLPGTYRAFLETLGNGFGGPYYGVSPLDEWCAPEDQSALPEDILCTPFAPDAPRVAGLAPGALRICNAGCEHYYLLVVSGRHAGEIWHDGETDHMGLRKMALLGTEDCSFASWLEVWLDWISAGGSDRGLVPDGFWVDARYPGHAVAQVVADLSRVATNDARTVAADQLPCPACVQLLVTGSISRIVVPAMARNRRRNPKLVARAAARNSCKTIPLLVYP
jgi:hypothetical protein